MSLSRGSIINTFHIFQGEEDNENDAFVIYSYGGVILDIVEV